MSYVPFGRTQRLPDVADAYRRNSPVIVPAPTYYAPDAPPVPLTLWQEIGIFCRWAPGEVREVLFLVGAVIGFYALRAWRRRPRWFF